MYGSQVSSTASFDSPTHPLAGADASTLTALCDR